ncbi:MAG: response regulator [Proteobacteria bacterium]|nr:MAG: response regulator [Pseudomonadota bacterium]
MAGDGAAALVEARRENADFDMLVTDLNMPFMTGEDLIHALRLDRPELPVVVVTGAPPAGGLNTLRRLGGGTGAMILLHKPINFTELLSAVDRVRPRANSPEDILTPGQLVRAPSQPERS